MQRAVLLFILISATAASAEPFRISVNYTVGGRWLEATRVYAGRNSVQLEGSELSMGGTLDLMKRFGALRVGGQVGTDVMLFPRDLEVMSGGPLNTTELSEGGGVTSLLFLSASPFVGAGIGETGHLQASVDLLVSLELTSARVDRERHFALTPVPTVRLGAAFPIGSEGTALELSFLASYFGAPRLAMSMGARF